MHIFVARAPVIRSDGQELAAGSYLAEDANCAELAVTAPRLTFEIEPFHRWYDRQTFSLWPKLEANTESLLIVAPGGLGDTMLLTPVLASLRASHPTMRIGLSLRQNSRCVLDHLGLVDQFEDYPLPCPRLRSYEVMIALEGCNECGPGHRTQHAIDNKAQRIGVTLHDQIVRYHVTDEERAAALVKCPKTSAPRLAIQLAASAFNRCYPHQKLGHVMAKFYEKGWEIFLMGTPGSTDQRPVPKQYADRVRDLARERLSFRESVAALMTCDVVLAPDSALMHAAGALQIPCVALFGPIHWATRTSHYPTVRAIQGNGGCSMAPCFHHQIAGFFWPKGGPCEKSGVCEPLANIEPDAIVRAIEKAYRG